jgi:hypothetical protein
MSLFLFTSVHSNQFPTADPGASAWSRKVFVVSPNLPYSNIPWAGYGRISILLNFTRIVTEPFTEGFGSGDSCACTGVDILDVWQRSKLPKPSPITCKNYQPSHDLKGVFEPFHALSPTLTLLIVKPWQLETSLNSFSPLLYFLSYKIVLKQGKRHWDWKLKCPS